ncbi:carboxylate-amine ligase [Leucobacter ruminantium]|uniref:Putative glutamate--cysteine ligase 2 n=1 Tax=Leucobacter ruminantium TaxID=1289170 RepID=A0A939LT33_9MICO|nr:glutamate--cysteine ligase [Leucobacter ruminantium]MBO1804340.1 glutamate--cysteine ligase [Leucobacter ruminantium]
MTARSSVTLRGDAPRFGVEEEYLLLDSETGLPRDGADELIAELPGLRAEHEFFHSQLETATPVCGTAAEAFDSLREFRSAASAAAARHGLVLAGTGLPPIGATEPGRVTDNPRYGRIQTEMREMVKRYYSTGTHVHIEVPSRDAGVDVFPRIARWSPVLVALTANSPIWLGADSGYASWRYLQLQQWSSSGYPPRFEDAAEYERIVEGLVRTGALFDKALVNWSIRLSEKFPTIELRTADAQLASDDAVAFALILRALVHHALAEGEAGEQSPAIQPDLLRGAHWVAARNGLGSELADPENGESRAAFELVDELVERIAPSLEATGDLAHVERFVAARRADGGPAAMQSRAWREGGIAAVLELYRQGSLAAA